MSALRRIVGWIVIGCVAAVMLIAAAGKVFGFAPDMVMQQLESYGLADKVLIIAVAEALSAILLLLPQTWMFGLLMASAFWGGAIVAHLTGDDYRAMLAPILLLGLTWVGDWLRHPETCCIRRPGARASN